MLSRWGAHKLAAEARAAEEAEARAEARRLAAKEQRRRNAQYEAQETWGRSQTDCQPPDQIASFPGV